MRAAAVLALLMLSACASVSREECVQGDWPAIGLRDGQAGLVADRQFARHIDACAKVGITPDRAAWARGYAQGLATYCTPRTGLEQGLQGRSYRGVCPPATEGRFQQAHQIGRAVFDQRARVSGLENEMSALRSQAAQLRTASATDPTAAAQAAGLEADALRLQLEISLERMTLLQLERAAADFRATLP